MSMKLRKYSNFKFIRLHDLPLAYLGWEGIDFCGIYIALKCISILFILPSFSFSSSVECEHV